MNRVLTTINNINKIIMREKDIKNLIGKVIEELFSLEGVRLVWTGIKRDNFVESVTSSKIDRIDLNENNATCVRTAIESR